MYGKCFSCRWWGGEQKRLYSDLFGTCRVSPPRNGPPLVFHPEGIEPAPAAVVRGEWVWTADGDWCKRHEEFPTQPPRRLNPDDEIPF